MRAEIPTKSGLVYRLMHRSLRVGKTGICIVDKPMPPTFTGFADYALHLKRTYRRIAENARDERRGGPMAIFSTQSRGYDTTAVNAVAASVGVDRACTVARGKAIGYFGNEDRAIEPDDDGSEICEKLGIHSTRIDRRYVERNPRFEYLFHAGMHRSGDFNLAEISENVSRPTVLLTGTLGEIWYPRKNYVDRPGFEDSTLKRWDLGCHGLTEVRLEAGYVQLAMPYIGAVHRRAIVNLTESPEMDAWRLGTSYDRTIPRRLAEEAGVPRDLFGQAKMASVLEFPQPTVPIGNELRDGFLRFMQEIGLLNRLQCAMLPVVLRWNAAVWSHSPRRHRWMYILERVLTRLSGRGWQMPLIWTRLNAALFVYCVSLRQRDYAQGLSAQSRGRNDAPRDR